MKRYIFGVLAIVIVALMALSAFAGPSDTFVLYPYSADPCQNTSIAKSSAIISNTTTTLISSITNTTSGKALYICNVTATASGASTFQLTSASTTTTACDTASTNLTPAFDMATGASIRMSFGGTLFKTVAAQNLCTNSTGTVRGVVTYVKQ